MASVTVFNLTAGTALASGDVLVFCDISNTAQSANGSDLKITITNFFATVPVPIIVTSASANALAVGLAGTTNPAFLVDASTATSATGLKVKSAAAAAGVALSVISSGADENLTIDAKGAGTITIAGTSTGRVTITPVTTITGVLTLTAQPILSSLTASQAVFTDGSKGLVSNAITGSGNVVMSAGPTLTGTITAAIANFSGLVTANLGLTVASGQTLTLTGATVAGAPTWSSSQAITISTATQASITTMANLTTVGALVSGSLAAGFGNISIGASSVTAGAASFTTGLFAASSAGSANTLEVRNTSTAASANGATINVRATGEDNTGDAWVRFISKDGGASETNWSMGVDTSATQAFVITEGTTLGVACMSIAKTTRAAYFDGAMTLNSTLAVTGTSTLTGNVGVGVAADATTALYMTSAGMTGVQEWGVCAQPVFGSGATTAGYTIYAQLKTSAQAYTMVSGYAFHAAAPVLGNTAVTNIYGFYVANQGQAKSTNAYGIYIAAQSGAVTTNVGLYNGGTSRLDGVVAVGTDPSTTMALQVQQNGLTGVSQRGVSVSTTFTNAATTSGMGIYTGVRTAAAAFTMVTGTGLRVDVPVIGAASAITTLYGAYVSNQGAAGVTNAYGVYIEAQSGAATTNIGLYNAGTTTLVGATSTYNDISVHTVSTGTGTGPKLNFYNATTTLYGQMLFTNVASGTCEIWTNAAASLTASFAATSVVIAPALTVNSTVRTTALGINGAPTATSKLNITGLPVAAAGLAAGDVWSNGGVLTIV